MLQLLRQTTARPHLASTLGLRPISALTSSSTQNKSPCMHISSLLPSVRAATGNTRTYGTKAKSTSTATLVPGSQQRLTSEVARQEYSKAEEKMEAAVDRFRRDCAAAEVRASGRVSSALLDSVRVALPGGDVSSVPLEEVASIGVKDGTTLIVGVFEANTLKHVESAIYDAKLPHIAPQRVDDRTLRIAIAKPTMETRTALYTNGRQHAEDARMQVRRIQQVAVKRGKFGKHSIELEEFQKLTDRYVGEVDKILSQLKKDMAVR